MFARVYFYLLFFSTVFVAAIAAPQNDFSKLRCGGNFQCCASLIAPTRGNLGDLFNILDRALGPLGGLVGVTCTGLGSVTGGGSDSCPTSPVCCTQGTNFGGIFSLGCKPVD